MMIIMMHEDTRAQKILQNMNIYDRSLISHLKFLLQFNLLTQSIKVQTNGNIMIKQNP